MIDKAQSRHFQVCLMHAVILFPLTGTILVLHTMTYLMYVTYILPRHSINHQISSSYVSMDKIKLPNTIISICQMEVPNTLISTTYKTK